MAYSYAITVASGASALVSVPFPYLDKADIHVALNGTQVDDSSFVWITDGQIQLSAAPAFGTIVKVYRQTPVTNAIVTFSSGDLDPGDLNAMALQGIYAAQEGGDYLQATMHLADNGQSYDAGGYEVTNASPGTTSSSLVTVSQLQGIVAGAGNVPTPVSGDVGKSLTATGAGTWGWNPQPDISALVSGPASAVVGNIPQFGNVNGKSLTDSGVKAALAGLWASFVEVIKTTDYLVALTDVGKGLVANKGTAITFTLPTALSATGLVFVVRNIGAGVLTLDGNGSETIEGATTFPVVQGSAVVLRSNGTLWRADNLPGLATSAQAIAGTATGVFMDPAKTLAALQANQKVLQRAYAEYTTNAALTANIPIDDTVPLSTEGTQILSASFTPKSASSTIRLSFFGWACGGTGTSTLVVSLFEGTTCRAAASTYGNNVFPVWCTVEVASGSTTARTYSVRAGASAGSMFFNGSSGARYLGGAGRAVLIIEELTP